MVWVYWVYWLLLVAAGVGGLVLCAFTLPGTWLILGASALYAWPTRGHFIGWKTLLVLLLLALTAEVGEFVVGGAGAKKAGASKWGIFGGLLGAIVGGIFWSALIPVPILGTVVGICLGSFAGAFAVELVLGKEIWPSLKIGLGAAKGRLMGIMGKVTIGLAMFTLSVLVALPVWGGPSRKALPRATTLPATTMPTTR